MMDQNGVESIDLFIQEKKTLLFIEIIQMSTD